MRYRISGECTHPFQVQKSIRQACVLEPLLFRLFLNDLVHYLLEEQLPVIGGRRVPRRVLMACTENAAHRLLGGFAKYCDEKSLTINCSETMKMTLRPSPSLRRKLVINDVPIDAIKHFDYLGVRFTDNLNWDSHVRKVAIVLKQAGWQY
ncbi:hypothetical protein NDU88_002041 [Pleurodeles waltl]|uniref:Uncharacterized protein n=1 Tax=Pleurodeles waltl TaxID=8319 RepID=A0AAV7R8V0_PLEWA|nr:hypothetical protein NDU88_002041 [Pleurodeles waltl]